jgi:hypothetical protein
VWLNIRKHKSRLLIIDSKTNKVNEVASH